MISTSASHQHVETFDQMSVKPWSSPTDKRTRVAPDAPKICPINAFAIDWWYFGVVSTDPKSRASVVLVFSAVGVPDMPLRVQATVSFPNDTLTSTETVVPADRATVTAEGNGSSGDWHGSGFTWQYSARSGSYDIFIDSPDLDMEGQIHFQQRAPAHYPCGPAVNGGRTQYWVGECSARRCRHGGSDDWREKARLQEIASSSHLLLSLSTRFLSFVSLTLVSTGS
ncbi:hypothetical protein MVEN_00157200 [Mycena venus]|uniref:Diels-Alderase N-terminal domain-containing protein n=1 Tax=Mycena venus TaxID=2733690 RepID=A0A8H6Z0X4_9AGAR|nr:hypothetical protein MVEN_00157200 [Mycena venus]